MKKKPTASWSETNTYLHGALALPKLLECLRNAKKRLKGVEFDAVAVTGVSGIAFGAVLAFALKKHLVVVRKEESPPSHSWKPVEGPVKVTNYLFVDDLVDSGDTFRRVVAAVAKRYPAAHRVGVLCYHQTPHEADVDGSRVFPAA